MVTTTGKSPFWTLTGTSPLRSPLDVATQMVSFTNLSLRVRFAALCNVTHNQTTVEGYMHGSGPCH